MFLAFGELANKANNNFIYFVHYTVAGEQMKLDIYKDVLTTYIIPPTLNMYVMLAHKWT